MTCGKPRSEAYIVVVIRFLGIVRPDQAAKRIPCFFEFKRLRLTIGCEKNPENDQLSIGVISCHFQG